MRSSAANLRTESAHLFFSLKQNTEIRMLRLIFIAFNDGNAPFINTYMYHNYFLEMFTSEEISTCVFVSAVGCRKVYVSV